MAGGNKQPGKQSLCSYLRANDVLGSFQLKWEQGH